MTLIAFLSLMFAATAACVAVSYEEYARTAGWSVGRMFIGTGFVKGFMALNGIAAVGLAWINYSFFWALGVFVAGWVFSFVFTLTLKKWAQVGSLVLLVLSYALQFFITA